MKKNIGLPEQISKEVSVILNRVQADLFVLYAKTKLYHWNVTGPFFGPLHSMFDDQAAELLEMIDATAEKVRALNVLSIGRLIDYKANSSLTEDDSTVTEDIKMLDNLLHDRETIIRQLRIRIDQVSSDVGTVNFLTDMIEKHEKTAWMLRSIRHHNKP
jgi:starvation-inducible DNA-binding protein